MLVQAGEARFGAKGSVRIDSPGHPSEQGRIAVHDDRLPRADVHDVVLVGQVHVRERRKRARLRRRDTGACASRTA